MNETFSVSARKIAQELKNRREFKSVLGTKQEDVLKVVGKGGIRTAFLNDVTKGAVYYVNEFQARNLAELFSQGQNWRRFIHDLHPLDYREDVLVPREAGSAEILCETFSTENLLRNTKIGGYIQLFIDDVQFRKEQDDGGVIVDQGSYVRILPAAKSDGAITLIAHQKEERLLLISEYRHNTQSYLVEACRGFGSHEDTDEKQTGRRERWEETWIPEAWVKGHVELGRAFTDSGKLREQPAYFLEFVHPPEDKDTHIARLRPVMTDPVWIPLKRFYEAIFADEAVRLAKNEFDFYLREDQRAELNTNAPINNGSLMIEDNFTITVGFLALPHLAKHYHLRVSDILGI